MSQHYATLLGLGAEWKVTKVDLDVLGKKLDIYLEYAADAAICPVCGKLGNRISVRRTARRAIQTHQSKPFLANGAGEAAHILRR